MGDGLGWDIFGRIFEVDDILDLLWRETSLYVFISFGFCVLVSDFHVFLLVDIIKQIILIL